MEPPRKKRRRSSPPCLSVALRPRELRPFDIDIFPHDIQCEIFLCVDFFVFHHIACADRKRNQLCERVKDRFCHRWVERGDLLPNGVEHGPRMILGRWLPFQWLAGDSAASKPYDYSNEPRVTVVPYVRGVRHGKTRQYSYGALVREENWENGKESGEYTCWDVEGRVLEKGNHKDGLLHGTRTRWWLYVDEMQLMQEEEYENGFCSRRTYYNLKEHIIDCVRKSTRVNRVRFVY